MQKAVSFYIVCAYAIIIILFSIVAMLVAPTAEQNYVLIGTDFPIIGKFAHLYLLYVAMMTFFGGVLLLLMLLGSVAKLKISFSYLNKVGIVINIFGPALLVVCLYVIYVPCVHCSIIEDVYQKLSMLG